MTAKGRGRRRPGPPASRPRRPKATTPTEPRSKPTRTERFDAARHARRRRSLRNRIVVGLVLAAGFGAVVVNEINDRRQDRRVVAELTAGSCRFDRRSDSGRAHVQAPAYEVDPPSGGDHLAAPASAGSYSEGQLPADDSLVHSLEHGFVILWHRPDVDLEIIDEVAGRFDRDVLVVARQSLPTPVAATAWHKRLLCQRTERAALARFVDEYRNDGPEDVPH